MQRLSSRRSLAGPSSRLLTPPLRPFYRLFVNLGFVEHPDVNRSRIYFAIVDQYLMVKWAFAL